MFIKSYNIILSNRQTSITDKNLDDQFLNNIENIITNKGKIEDNSKKFICHETVYLGSIDIFFDCNQKCEFEKYEYKFIDENETVVINKKKLMGAYCLKKSIAACNLNTSLLIKSINSFKCISKFPSMIGGVNGNLIIGCNGKFFDRVLKITYETFVPQSFSIESFDEKLPDKSFRFVCVVDESKTLLPSDVGSRFELEDNVCAYFDKKGFMDFETGNCKCNLYIGHDSNSICTICESRFGRETLVHGSQYGYSVARECVDPKNAEFFITNFIKIACGDGTLSRNATCEYGLILATNTYTPMALENITKN